MESLIKADGNVNTMTDKGTTLTIAAERGNFNFWVRKSKIDWTFVLIFLKQKCVYIGDLELVKLLVENGANINARNNYEKTPLDWPISDGSFKLERIELISVYWNY